MRYFVGHNYSLFGNASDQALEVYLIHHKTKIFSVISVSTPQFLQILLVTPKLSSLAEKTDESFISVLSVSLASLSQLRVSWIITMH
jgi:hypothetical protein